MNLERHIVSVVRGEVPWPELQRAGVEVTLLDQGCSCEGTGMAVVRPTIVDLSVGLLRMMDGPGATFRQWACVMLAASSVIDLSLIEQHPDGELVLEALWSASEGEPIDPEGVARMREIAEHGGHRF